MGYEKRKQLFENVVKELERREKKLTNDLIAALKETVAAQHLAIQLLRKVDLR